MLQSIVGPPNVGVADFKSPDKIRDEKGRGSDSFEKVLGDKENTPPTRSKDEVSTRSADSSRTNPQRALPLSRSEQTVKSGSREDTSEDRDRSEKEDSAEPAVASTNEGIVKQGQQQRQHAILKFMDSFESEFGVPPTKMVEAMAKLKPTELKSAPEQTASQVIGKLDLSDEQKARAQSMYSALLTQLTQIDQKQDRPAKAFAIPAQDGSQKAMLGRFGVETEKATTTRHALDSMNDRFWMKDDVGMPRRGAEMKGEGAMSGDALADKISQLGLRDKLIAPAGQLQVDEASFQNLRQAPPMVAGDIRGDKLQEPSADNQDEEADEALAGLVAAARALRSRQQEDGGGDDDVAIPGMERMPEQEGIVAANPGRLQARSEVANGFAKNLQQAQGREQQGFQGGHGQHQGAQQHQMSSAMGQAKAEMMEKARASQKADFQKVMSPSDDVASAQTPTAQPLVKDAAEAGLAANAGVKVTPAEHEANVRQVMNQAQYLIKKGGGEMKVQMTPEGLGQVHMKVAVQDGKVSLQMQASSPEAKKALEAGMTDLKNSLAAHKLSMDHVKVDVVGKAGTENNTQNQPQSHQQSAREQTRQFWDRFNDSFGSSSQQRDGFADIPNMRGYPQKRTDAPLRPVESNSVGTRRYAGGAKGSGLDLVA